MCSTCRRSRRMQLCAEPGRFNATDVVELYVRMLSQRAEEAGVIIEREVDAALPVTADRRAMRQILLNLLSNAIKFTPKDGVIVVMARRLDDQLVLGVGDGSPGIPADELSQLGQRYMQATTARNSAERGSGARTVARQGAGGNAWR